MASSSLNLSYSDRNRVRAFITAPLLLPNDEFHLLHFLSITVNLFLLFIAVIWRLQLWWIPSGHNSSLYKRTVWCRGTLWMCCICPLTLTQFPACEPFHAILDTLFVEISQLPNEWVYFRKENFLILQSVHGNQSNRLKVETRVYIVVWLMSFVIFSAVIYREIKLNKAVRVIRIYLVL